MSQGSNIGMMDKAYFVGRKEIIDWINTKFALNIARIEDTASGAVACQIADAVFPGEVPLHKVKWDAKNDYEFVHNYKILQQVFQRKGVDKHVEVERLIRAKYQDNLEFMQWMKRWCELNSSATEDYDPVERRKGRGVVTSAPAPAAAAPAAPAAAAPAPAPAAAAPRVARAAGAKPAAAASSSSAPSAGGESAAARKRDEEIAQLKVTVEGLEKERDFYFGKLRDIEILLQSYAGPDKDMSDQIFKILYATEEDFVVLDQAPADAGDS